MPLAPTKFCVGAVLVDAEKNEILSTGWSLELPDDNPADPGKTHAERCCFIKVARKHGLPEERMVEVLPKNTVLYTTMEPCNKRLSGNKPCMDRILRLKESIKVVYIGIKEPESFIDQDVLVLGRKRLEDAGVKVEFVEGLESRILAVAMAGHEDTANN
ncbi:Bifunctional protein RIB2 [Lachnellula suecica]|uniref:Bifunctional protein RIB2 n=1 Tax=Lachnellula suecica TaxID=602035 RepID=A0A8T9C0W8_9HELO|nr:Bifunctional protein RIB2 [Lachnellula suecica]